MTAVLEKILPQTDYARKITYTRTESGTLQHNLDIDLDRIYRAVENNETVYLHGKEYFILRVIMSPTRSFVPMMWEYSLELGTRNGCIQAPAEHVKFKILKKNNYRK